MPAENSAVKAEDFLHKVRDQIIPFDSPFSYFASPAMADDDLRQYLHEPVAALPPAIRAELPPTNVFLVPFLERVNGKGVVVSMVRVAEELTTPVYKLVSKVASKSSTSLFFSIKDEEVSEYHYSFYNEIAGIIARGWTGQAQDAFLGLVRGELAAKVNGEIDEKSWHLKQALLRRTGAREAKMFRDYGRQAFEDTLTLYLHGICCDIDVETGPRQMPSRQVRKRLEVLHELFPPPAGHAVFPEQLSRK